MRGGRGRAIKRFEGLGLSLALTVSAAVSACGRSDDWQASAGPAQPTRLCVDDQGRRLPDQACAAHGGGAIAGWYYLSGPAVRDAGIPRIGALVAGGAYVPTTGVSYAAAPARGIARGGFGATAEGGEGHGEGHGGGRGAGE
jgi:hypothetical protein